jgi:hypothetical protein
VFRFAEVEAIVDAAGAKESVVESLAFVGGHDEEDSFRGVEVKCGV